MAHIRQSRPDFGLGFKAKVVKPLEVVPSSLGSGRGESACLSPTCPHSGTKSPLLSLLICTTGRQIPASSSANQGNGKRRFGPPLGSEAHLVDEDDGGLVFSRDREERLRTGYEARVSTTDSQVIATGY